MNEQRAAWLRVTLVGGLMAACLALGCLGGVPDRLPGVALGSGLILVLERALLIGAIGMSMIRSLYDAWHGRAFGMDLGPDR